tara:strand:- start:4091 stop:4327 length:237 start_codon:yes stop_codon:yes gene_type:complete
MSEIIDFPTSKIDNDTFEDKIDALPKLMVDQAYSMLKSGETLSASDLKVCLEITKQYGVEIKKEPENILTDNLPFDEE